MSPIEAKPSDLGVAFIDLEPSVARLCNVLMPNRKSPQKHALSQVSAVDTLSCTRSSSRQTALCNDLLCWQVSQ